MSNTFNLGKPIGEHVSSLPQGEHGAGVGLAGGHGTANASNTQSGQFAESERSGFNHGLGGEHASGGIPSSGQSAHPIADKFTSGGAGVGAGSGLDNKLDNFSGSAAPRGDAVSGSYAGDGTSDALTGESHAQRTGAGVGPLGENLGAGALAGGAAGGAAGLATAKSGVDTKGVDPSTQYGTGVGASGGSGGHYTTDSSSTTGQHGHSGAAAAGLGAGAVGAGAAGASGAQGHFGTQETDFDRGAPVSDPKELDSGGRHGLVFDEKTGKYLHRHEIEESK